jgi:hypothetical protein
VVPDGETKLEAKGVMADGSRAMMSYLQPNYEDLLIRKSLADHGYTGSETLLKQDPKKKATAMFSPSSTR